MHPLRSVQSSRGTGFDAIEDEQLVIDTSNIQDGDGIGNTQIQWQISENGDGWSIVPGAITHIHSKRPTCEQVFARSGILCGRTRKF